MVEAGQLQDENDSRKLTNMSARKFCEQKLKSGGVPDIDIVKVTGHKSLTSLNAYDKLSTA